MSSTQSIAQPFVPVAELGVDARGTFITKTYLHLLGAVLLFTLIETWLFSSGLWLPIAQAMLGTSWLVVLGLFMLVSWGASRAAAAAQSKPAQYLGLAALVGAYAVIFVPMLYMAEQAAPGTISSAAGVTLAGFLGLTLVAFVTRRDFSFMRGVLGFGFVIALVLIVAGVLLGFQLGTWFSVAMIGFAGAAILYDTSNVIHHYPEDRYVSAALQLFASVALMFWYVLRLFMSRD